MPAYRAPWKSGVHRAAGIALYRALVRSTRLEELQQESRQILRATITQRFRREQYIQKPSGIKDAFQLGYESLRILRKAPQEGLACVQQLVDTIVSICPPKPKLEPKPRISKAEEKEQAEKGLSPLPVIWKRPGARSILDRPLPLDQIKGGRRRVPIYSVSNGVGFLRVGKPQSPYFSRVLRNKLKQQHYLTVLEQELKAQLATASGEDDWDAIIAQHHGIEEVSDGHKSTWLNTVRQSVSETVNFREELWARKQEMSLKLWEIHKAEKRLAKEERDLRKAESRKKNA